MTADGTIALCATCHRAIYHWLEYPMMGGDLGPIAGYWTHFRNSDDRHDAVPALSLLTTHGRTLICAGCHRPQAVDEHGFHCANVHCPARVDND